MPRGYMTRRCWKWIAGSVGALGTAALGACGAGAPVSQASLPASIEVRVSAGAPVAGALVTAYAISDVTGLTDATVGAGGVLGSAGPTDSSGRVTLTLASRGYSGPVQLVASGPSMLYPDPTTAPASSAMVQVPATFSLSSYVGRFSAGAPVVPITLMTTLADRAALAWARGRHPLHRTPSTLSAALAARDPLFVSHVTRDATAWSPTTFRSTAPALLTDGPHTLVDAAYAALFDLALNQLAHEIAARANSNAITAVVLAQLLEDDLDADGRFDGRGVGGLLLATPGNPPVALDDQLLRVPMAQALDDWIRNTAANASGIAQPDLVGAKVYDAMTTDASDLFGSPPALGVFDPVDRTPPVLAFASEPPRYANQTTLMLTVNASDSTGVQGVFAQSGTRKYTATAAEGGRWTLAIDLVPGHNQLIVWAVDTTRVGNSGLGTAEPYQYTLDVLLDTSPPAAIYDASFKSYVPEGNTTVATGGDGAAIVPAQPSGGAKESVPANGEVFKMATRLSAGGPFDVLDLEGANTANLPVLRYAVQYDPDTDSPIIGATYSAQVSCPGCEFPVRSGAMLPSPNASPGFLFLDLPLAVETIPDLATITGPATVAVKLTLGDAAGNVAAGLDGGSYTFHVLGPALAIQEDPGYATAGDPRGTFMYASSAPGYAALFDSAAASFLPDRQVRLAKYVITNPWTVPVLADARLLGGSWAAIETWRGEMLRMPALAYNADGMLFGGTSDWAATCDGYSTFPCGGAVADQDAKYPVHVAGSATQYECDTKPGVAGSTGPWASAPADLVGTQQAAAAAELHAFTPGAPWDASPAQSIAGLLVVPAATSSAPGRLHVYVTRPAGTGGRTIPLSFGASNPNSPVPRFEQWEWDHWMDTDPTRGACTFNTVTIVRDCGLCGSNSLGCMFCGVRVVLTNSFRHWWAYRHVRFLAAAADNLSGTLSIASMGLASDRTTPVGEPSVQASNISVQRSIPH
jgi:hypothetical protein